jgi:hypothetical protein
VHVGGDADGRQLRHDLRRDTTAVVGDDQRTTAQTSQSKARSRRRDHADSVPREAFDRAVDR